jgi:hypothetical protein
VDNYKKSKNTKDTNLNNNLRQSSKNKGTDGTIEYNTDKIYKDSIGNSSRRQSDQYNRINPTS